MVHYRVVIPAAGQGKRMKAGINKQFIAIGGKPMIVHTLSIFQTDPNCAEIVLVVNKRDMEDVQRLVNAFALTKVSHLAIGGKERQNSVYEGLKRLTVEDGIVLIHDGARPFVTQEMIRRVVRKASATGAAVLAVPVKDTIKQVDGESVVKTVDRSGLWAVHTPQAFRLSIIKEAHRQAETKHIQATDDAALAEMAGYPVSVVSSDYFNIKITTPEDLLVAEAILAAKEGENS